jgi:5'-methylthioadenosine phosphorylase
MTEQVQIGVIGGSGLYDMSGISDRTEYDIDTPFGKPSAPIMVGTLRGKRVAFIPRHGVGHIHTPTTVPYRANIYALKSLGVRFIVAVSACGSLQQAYAPGHLVLPDQLYDHTKSDRRDRSFYEDSGLVAHVGVADPFDGYLRDVLYEAIQGVGGTAHNGGLFITVEGPRFSTRGESKIFRAWGCDLIGMTTSPEAYLAAEAEIAYACIAHVTDYDVWHETEEAVTVEQVMKTAIGNIETAKAALADAVAALDVTAERPAHSAVKLAITTNRDHISDEAREKLNLIVGKYL